MSTLTARLREIPDDPIPGRYSVVAFMGKKPTELARWRSLVLAGQHAEGAFEAARTDTGKLYDRIEVRDRFSDGRTIVELRRPSRRSQS